MRRKTEVKPVPNRQGRQNGGPRRNGGNAKNRGGANANGQARRGGQGGARRGGKPYGGGRSDGAQQRRRGNGGRGLEAKRGGNRQGQRSQGRNGQGAQKQNGQGGKKWSYRAAKAAHSKKRSYALQVERIRVRDDRVVVYLTLPNKRWRYTTPALAKRVMHDYPTVVHHTCVNAKGNTFGSVIRRTPLPHLMEHLTIDILAGRSTDPDDMFTGFSTWVGENHEKARVEVSMKDDVNTIKAVKEAAAYINSAAFELDEEHSQGK